MSWNYDMTTAPRGGFEKTTRIVGKNEVTVEIYRPVRVIVGGKCGTVTASEWNPKRNAWSMFSADVPPIAWMPWPAAPEARP